MVVNNEHSEHSDQRSRNSYAVRVGTEVPRNQCRGNAVMVRASTGRLRVVESHESLHGSHGGSHDSSRGDAVPLRVHGALATEAPRSLKPAEP